MKRALLVFALAGCTSAELVPPQVRSRIGPVAATGIKRVVALPATCGSLQLQRARVPRAGPPEAGQVEECSPRALEGVDQAIRAAVDFAGYEVIDAERINAVMASRREVERWRGSAGTRTTETAGALFEDVTPVEQAEILKELRADGVLNARVGVGAAVGFGERRTVVVQVRLVTSPQRALVWARRCQVEVGVVLDTQAMERAARCAAEGTPRR